MELARNPAANKTCHNCQRKGHFARDCPFPKKVQQVEAEASPSQPASAEGNGGNGKPKATPKPQVRRLMLNLDDFSESNEDPVCVVQMDRLDCKHFSPCVCFSACSSIGQCASVCDGASSGLCAKGPGSCACLGHSTCASASTCKVSPGEGSSLMRRVCGYIGGLISGCCVSHNAALHEPPSQERRRFDGGCVRVLSQDDELGEEVEFILDSGSDASCLPPSLQWVGKLSSTDRSKYSDAQGNPLHVSGTRRAVLTFADQDQRCSGVISETFLVAPSVETLSLLLERCTVPVLVSKTLEMGRCT